jgi:hypothetical protein
MIASVIDTFVSAPLSLAVTYGTWHCGNTLTSLSAVATVITILSLLRGILTFVPQYVMGVANWCCVPYDPLGHPKRSNLQMGDTKFAGGGMDDPIHSI